MQLTKDDSLLLFGHCIPQISGLSSYNMIKAFMGFLFSNSWFQILTADNRKQYWFPSANNKLKWRDLSEDAEDSWTQHVIVVA